MSLLLTYLAFAIGGFYLLWVIYLAVMNLKRARDAGLLNHTALALGTPLLFVGYLLDAALNVFVMSLVMWELPQEVTVSARLKRHNRDPQCKPWRKAIVRFFEPILDPYDPSGDHV